MSNSTIITDYLGRGTFANRPATPPVPTGGMAFYYATDTGVVYAWNGTAWTTGTGAGAQFNISGAASAETKNFACRGNVITPDTAMSVTSVSALITTVTGASYKIGIAPYNAGTNQITSAPTYSAIFTEGTGVALAMITCPFVTPVALAADTTYIMFIVRTDATSTTAFTVNFTNGPLYSPGLYVPNTGGTKILASLAPLVSDTWTDDAGSVYTMPFTYTMP